MWSKRIAMQKLVAGRVLSTVAGTGQGQQGTKPSGCSCLRHTEKHINPAVHAIIQFLESLVRAVLLHLLCAAAQLGR
ncbi:hypothetical protein QBC41DRAFT_330300 [Cercophora samala]|uniref:Uncharacterized protein n=1 Tax=Cercophora samala TaxID=330535 RepID=A0AA39YZT4_9PEZI|nr:hypothetical protein QBC41DRAFT_330300 [Cercophora samala]